MQPMVTDRNAERGAALIMAIICLMIITGLATAMLTSGRTEALIARNEERATHARMAAEAGLNHGIEAVAANLMNWQANGFTSANLAVTDLLIGPDNTAGTSDDGSLTDLGFAAPTARTTLSASAGTSYSVRSYDDDNTAAARKITLSTADITRIEENNNVNADNNKRIVIFSTGYGPGGTVTTLEATVGPTILPAVITNGDLNINGNVGIVGTNGSVHSNSNFSMNGGSANITEDCTASGTFSGSTGNCGGYAGGSRPTITVPNVWAADYLSQATYILHSDGRMERTSDGAILCTGCGGAWGWSYAGGNWSLGSTEPANGAYYVEGNIDISGSPGSSGTPMHLTLIAEGYINISGGPDIQPFLPEIFMVTNMDLDIGGNLTQPASVEGQVLVREQVNIHGNVDLAGQLIVQDASNTCTLVTSNDIHGSVTITYNGMVGTNNYSILAWKEVR
jgi:Tfp pilus assembly protein PilX